MCINDLPLKVSSTTRLFADDSLLYRRIKNPKDVGVLQEDLDKLQEWERDRQMSLFASKCEVISLRVTWKRNPIKTTYKCTQYMVTSWHWTTGKYLGVTIADNLTWNAHVDTTSEKANNSLAFLRRHLASFPRDIKAQSYLALVRPILEYASTPWDPYTKSNIQQLEAVQRRAARFVTGDYRTTSSPSQMIADLGWEPLYQKRANFKLVMVYRHTYRLIDV